MNEQILEFFEYNYVKLYFATNIVFMLITGLLVNCFEPYLPLIIRKAFRYGKFGVKQTPWYFKWFELPKRYFRHFYLTSAILYFPVAYNESFSAFVFGHDVVNWFKYLLDFVCGPDRVATVSATRIFLAMTLLMLQVYRRCFDTLFVSVFSKTAKMNVFHYFLGMTYYPAVTLILLSEAPKFAKGMDDSVFSLNEIGYSEIMACFVFFWAWFHQHVATILLARLRKNRSGRPCNEHYKIPYGDWFEWFSSPHSIAEIIMYSALCLILRKHTGWKYVHLWVVVNQVETILLTHWWYKKRFGVKFPKDRAALIPGVY